MSRMPRNYTNAKFFHVMVQGINKTYIFNSSNLKLKYKKLMFDKKEKYEIDIIAYCIMDNHVHLLIYCQNTDEMSKFMKSLNQSYSQYYNKINERVGTLFRSRYKSEAILNQNYLETSISYIHNNPVKAELVFKMKDYYFSSYRDYLYKNGIVDDSVLKLLDWPLENYLNNLNCKLNETIQFIEIVEYEKSSIVFKEYIEKRNITFKEILEDEDMLLEIINLLQIRSGSSIRKIAELLNIEKSKLIRMLDNQLFKK